MLKIRLNSSKIISVRQGRPAPYEGREDMDEMPNAAEAIEKLAREAERLRLLELARECKDLDEFIEKVKAMTTAK